MSGRRKILALLITVAATIALGVSAYLTWVTWQSGTVVGCTAESLLDCDDVLASRWSKWFGLPVSLLGGLTYLAILGLCWPAAHRPNGVAMSGLFALALLAAGAAVWFVGLQTIQLQSFCMYCLTVHCCGLVVGVLTLLLYVDKSGSHDYDQMRSLLGVADADFEDDVTETAQGPSATQLLASLLFAAVGLAALMGGQLLSVPDETMVMEAVEFQPLSIDSSEELVADENPIDEGPTDGGQMVIATDLPSGSAVDGGAFENEPDTVASIFGTGPRQVVFRALPESIDVNSMPLMGSTEAPHVMLEMMDYTCDHCRKLHPHLHAALQRYGDQLAVLIHHVPLSKKCNQYVKKDFPGKKNACDYAQLAIGVWKLAPEKFPEYHHWLLESEKIPNIVKARRQAIRLVGEAILLEKKVKAETTKRLAKQATTFNRLNSGLPVLLFADGALRGVPDESQQLFDYLEATLGIEAR
ncbi:MAG: thioredoxin domain-containing protein [Planctomycetes bacterium]|nr:thioredoxin domain-containing protein [Planctomycetota bacterium]